ncbi:hypothetical protein KQI65_02355 [bacterium]|nr:hypothetical protein [bacterium]
MKHRFLVSVMLLLGMTALLTYPARSQQPSPPVQRAFHYQGCLTDASGNKINGTRDVMFELLDTDTSPMTVLFSETAMGLQVNDGIFEHAIGTVDTTGNPLPPLIFQKRVALRLTVDGETLDPIIPIFPSPVALVALYADSLKQPLPPGPQGPAGPAGPAGTNGKDGLNCWDANGNGIMDPAEDTNGDGSWDAADCKGPAGAPGANGKDGKDGKDGINCWDTNGNGMKDAAEDTNGDGVVDVNDCKGPKGDPGTGASDTLIIDYLEVTGTSLHEGNEHFKRGITVGGADSARSALRIDSTGEIYARSLHIIDPDVTGLYDMNKVVEFDSSGSVHRMPERYITFNPSDPTKSDTTTVTGKEIKTPAIEVFHPVTGLPLFRFDSSGSYHYQREFYLTPNKQNPTKNDTTLIKGDGVTTPYFEVYTPGNPERQAWIDSDGEGYFNSLHVLDSLGNPILNINHDGFIEFITPPIFYSGLSMYLENGNFLDINPLEGFTIKDPTNLSNPWVAHIDPNGNSLFTGAKNAIVTTKSYGVRKMYAEEATEVWFNDRGFGKLKNGEIRVELDPVFLETAYIDDDHPIHVRLTPTAECNGLYVAEKGDDYFIVRELMKGSSNATFDWEVNAKRRNYENERLESYDTGATLPGEVR